MPYRQNLTTFLYRLKSDFKAKCGRYCVPSSGYKVYLYIQPEVSFSGFVKSILSHAKHTNFTNITF